MKDNQKNFIKFYLLSVGIIALDQAVKMLVHFTMDKGAAGQVIVFADWFKIHYTTNPGMAFGMELGIEHGKLILTVFRLIATGAIGYYLYYLYIKKAPEGLLWSVALILGGAIGNLVDSIFYGIWLNNSPMSAPYALFHGQVVDMFYLDIWEGWVPEAIPIWGGKYISLWPIFNIADSSIFIGVGMILIFQNSFFKKEEMDEEEKVEEPAQPSIVETEITQPNQQTQSES